MNHIRAFIELFGPGLCNRYFFLDYLFGEQFCLFLFFLFRRLFNGLVFLIVFFRRHFNNYMAISLVIIRITFKRAMDIRIIKIQIQGQQFGQEYLCCIIKVKNRLNITPTQSLFILEVQNKIMINEDQLRLVSSLLLLGPLSFFLRFIKPTNIRYLYSLSLSCLLQIFVFRENMIGLYVQSAIVFLIIKFFRGKKVGVIVTIQSMLFLSFYHIRELIYNYGGWTMDASALLMILVCKYSLLAYAIQDGLTQEEKLTQEQKSFKITENISLLDYVGFLNFLPTSIIGPPLEYKEYKKFMELEKPYDSIPDTIKQALIAIGHSILCAGIFVVGETLFPCSYMKTDEFYQHNAFYVLFYSFISVTFIRFKYYFGWKLSIASVHASGISYNGQKFKLINTCSPVVIETDKHIRNKISHWNIAVQEWLRKCIYQRSPFKGRGLSQLWVFMVSAFWHGFYAGYYFAFFLWFVQVYTQGQIFRFVRHETSRLRKFYKKLGQGGNFAVSLIVNIIFSHNAAFFILLDYKVCFRLLEKVNYIPQTILITLAVTFTILNSVRGKKQKKTHHSIQAPSQKDETGKSEEKPLKKQ